MGNVLNKRFYTFEEIDMHPSYNIDETNKFQNFLAFNLKEEDCIKVRNRRVDIIVDYFVKENKIKFHINIKQTKLNALHFRKANYHIFISMGDYMSSKLFDDDSPEFELENNTKIIKIYAIENVIDPPKIVNLFTSRKDEHYSEENQLEIKKLEKETLNVENFLNITNINTHPSFNAEKTKLEDGELSFNLLEKDCISFVFKDFKIIISYITKENTVLCVIRCEQPENVNSYVYINGSTHFWIGRRKNSFEQKLKETGEKIVLIRLTKGVDDEHEVIIFNNMNLLYSD